MTKDDQELFRTMLAGIRNALQRSYILEILKYDKSSILYKEKVDALMIDCLVNDLATDYFSED